MRVMRVMRVHGEKNILGGIGHFIRVLFAASNKYFAPVRHLLFFLQHAELPISKIDKSR